MQAGQYIRQVAPHFLGVDQAAAGFPVEFTLAPGNNQDALAAAPLYRLDDERVVFLQGLDGVGNLVLVLDGAVQLRHRDAVRQGRLLGEQFVVNQRVIAARVVLADTGNIAPVHTQDTQLLEPAR